MAVRRKQPADESFWWQVLTAVERILFPKRFKKDLPPELEQVMDKCVFFVPCALR